MPPEVETFAVNLANFTGPFDLLLSLIARHQLDITEVALAQITDDFMAHIKAQEDNWSLSQASEFVVVAATLLDLKAASLLPGGLEQSEDFELLEARDLLVARLLQYRAFKLVAQSMQVELAQQSRYRPRSVGLEAHFAQLLPDLVWTANPSDLARLAASALARPPKPTEVPFEHLHAPKVSVPEQVAVLTARLRRSRTATFRQLVADAGPTVSLVVARFVAILELFRVGAVTFSQGEALGELSIHWSGPTKGEVRLEMGSWR
ncbi:MAG: segregation/condensation protein A [Micrococcales bacterium]|nr:segregation/condensation protein A [Micrococcales bacterium]